jgi:hypothetical protein
MANAEDTPCARALQYRDMSVTESDMPDIILKEIAKAAPEFEAGNIRIRLTLFLNGVRVHGEVVPAVQYFCHLEDRFKQLAQGDFGAKILRQLDKTTREGYEQMERDDPQFIHLKNATVNLGGAQSTGWWRGRIADVVGILIEDAEEKEQAYP